MVDIWGQQGFVAAADVERLRAALAAQTNALAQAQAQAQAHIHAYTEARAQAQAQARGAPTRAQGGASTSAPGPVAKRPRLESSGCVWCARIGSTGNRAALWITLQRNVMTHKLNMYKNSVEWETGRGLLSIFAFMISRS